MFQAMNFAFMLVETALKSLKQRVVVSFKLEEHCVGDVIGELEHTGIIRTRGVWKILRKISNSTDLRAAPTEGSNPRSGSLMKSSFCEYKKSTLCVTFAVKARKEHIEAPADFFHGKLYRVFSMERG